MRYSLFLLLACSAMLPAQDAGDCVAAAPLATAPIADER